MQILFGTVFSTSTGRILKLLSILHNKKGSIHFAKNNKNWLVNDGNGTYDDAMYLINKAMKWHKLLHKNIKCEVIIWSGKNEKQKDN